MIILPVNILLYDDDERLYTQARSMRVDVANGELSDEQRRERAAEMALRLCKLIGLDEGSDSDEEK